jgi:hypothetical protein
MTIIFNKRKITKFINDIEKLKPHIADRNVNHAAPWKIVLSFLKKINKNLPHNPTIPLRNMYPKKFKKELKQILVCQCLLQHYS